MVKILRNTIWLVDFGCNAHSTSKCNNMSLANEYNKEDNITIESVHNLPISHTGRGKLSYSQYSSFNLTHLLYVSNISTNLLSIHQLS